MTSSSLRANITKSSLEKEASSYLVERSKEWLLQELY